MVRIEIDPCPFANAWLVFENIIYALDTKSSLLFFSKVSLFIERYTALARRFHNYRKAFAPSLSKSFQVIGKPVALHLNYLQAGQGMHVSKWNGFTIIGHAKPSFQWRFSHKIYR